MRHSPVWLVAQREIREAVRRTAFKVTLLITMAAVAAAVVVPAILGGNDEQRTVTFVGAPTDGVRDAVTSVGPALDATITVTVASDDTDARRQIEDGEADVAVLADGSLLVDEPPDTDDPSVTDRLALVVGEAVRVQEGLTAAGLTPEQAAQALDNPSPPINSVQPADEQSASDDAARFAALAANILLFIFLQIYGTWILMGVIEEKQSRVIEVLISAVRPRQLLVGKVVGVGGTALVHGSLCVLTAVVAGLVSGSSLMSRVGVSTVLIAGLWLLVGYAFYCTVYAAAGSLCSRAEDAQGVSFPLMLPVFVGYFAGFSALSSGEDNAFLAVLSFLPPTAPLAMPVRYGIGAAPAWQVVVAVILTLAGAVVVGRLAGRIYERSLLRTGKRVRVKDALQPV